MRKADACPKCASTNETEVITGGITIRVYREGDYTVKDEIEYDKDTKHSKWFCTDCKHELEGAENDKSTS